MDKSERARETIARIEREIKYYQDKTGQVPVEMSAVWHGYIAALLEWDLISVEAHGELTELLPEIDENTATDDAMKGVFLGRSEYRE